jgi:hypothetical protein
MDFKLQLDPKFKKNLRGKFEKYYFEVGILNDKEHKNPKNKNYGLKDFYGKVARKTSNKTGSLTTAGISNIIREKYHFDYLAEPFKGGGDSHDIMEFSKQFFKFCFGRTQAKRLTNMLQAIVRNPILRGDYGQNAVSTIRAKGFNHFMVDTGQLFKAIGARVMKK